MKNKFLKLICIFFFVSEASAKWLEGDYGVFQGLDKITARIKTLNFEIGKHHKFGVLDINLKRCVYSKPTKTPESIAYIEIKDTTNNLKQKNQRTIVFNGWMFASSPSLNAMEHPVYDLVLIECKKFKTNSNGSLKD